jgi:predicted MPP superfamily phosphohydrolase
MSDIHNNHAAFAGLLRLVEREAPDYVCLAGDTLDRTDCDVTKLINWLKKLSKVTTVVIGLGNHELATCGFWPRRVMAGENLEFYAEVKKIKNCVLLHDTFATFEAKGNLTFGALNMPDTWYKARETQAEFRKVLDTVPDKALNKKRFNILLSHSPNGWLAGGKLLSRESVPILDKLDLILSGHNHGGLVPVVLRPLLMNHGFIGPKYKLFQPHAFGSWTDGETSLILSNGVTKFAETSGLSAAGRFLNKLYIPDVESIELTPGDEYSCLCLR